MLVNLGVVKEDETSPKTCLFHLWLLAFEFSETIMGFTRERCVILTSNRKKKILEEMKKPENYEGKRLVFQYGESIEIVENKLYEKDIVLKWEKNLVSDETHES